MADTSGRHIRQTYKADTSGRHIRQTNLGPDGCGGAGADLLQPMTLIVWGKTLVCMKMSTKPITQCNARDLLQPMALIVWGRTWVCINVDNELVCVKIPWVCINVDNELVCVKIP